MKIKYGERRHGEVRQYLLNLPDDEDYVMDLLPLVT